MLTKTRERCRNRHLCRKFPLDGGVGSRPVARTRHSTTPPSCPGSSDHLPDRRAARYLAASCVALSRSRRAAAPAP